MPSDVILSEALEGEVESLYVVRVIELIAVMMQTERPDELGIQADKYPGREVRLSSDIASIEPVTERSRRISEPT